MSGRHRLISKDKKAETTIALTTILHQWHDKLVGVLGGGVMMIRWVAAAAEC